MLSNILYFFWLIIPLIFFFIGATIFIERASTKSEKTDYIMYFRQGGFVSLCVSATFFIDFNIMPFIASFVSNQDYIGIARVMLLPLMLLLGSYTIGGSKEIKIEKNVSRYDESNKNHEQTNRWS